MSFGSTVETLGGGADARGAGTASLPCLNSNNCIEAGLNSLSTSHRKTAFALRENVARLAKKYGLERLGFFTLTFADHVTCPKVAGRRFHSLSSNVLVFRYEETITVLERMKSGRIHFHSLVVLPCDVRTGFDFGEASRGVYSSANRDLRAEWAFWRGTAKRYGFGRTELLPVKSTAEAISKYVGKYIAKHIEHRHHQDKGVRLVRYSKRASHCSTRFQFASQGSALWRHQVGEFARRNRCDSLEALSTKFGRHWAHHQREAILAIEPSQGGLWERWEADRILRSQRVARVMGITQQEAYASLYQRSVFKGVGAISFDVPAIVWAPKALPPPDVVTVWRDGQVSRR